MRGISAARTWSGASGVATLVAISLLASTIAGEVVVRQGSNDDLEFKVLHSPVAVEASLDDLMALPMWKQWTVSPLRRFYCDGVTIERIQLKKVIAGAAGHTSGQYDAIHVSVELRTRAQEDDMAADIEFALVDGDRRMLLGKLIDILIGAGDTESESVTFKISAVDRESWFGTDKHPTLRVTMTTRVN